MGNRALVFIVGALAVGALISPAHGQAGASMPVYLKWDASPDTNVVGYFLYYGPASTAYNQRFNVGSVTAATIVGLTPGTTNYFIVTAYDGQQTESVPSNEARYIVPGTLQSGLQPNNTFHLMFPVAAGHSYDVQYSDTLTNWATLVTIVGQTNDIYDLLDTNFPRVAKRFYRLILH